jgi:hypothetical protein
MLSAILEQYNGVSTLRIRPQCLTASRHFLQSRIPFSNLTFFSSKIQTGTYNGKTSQKQQFTNREAGVERKLTSQQLASRLDNAKEERFALLTMDNLRH